MSLTQAFSIARGALATGAAVSSLVSRNVANAEQPDASRKSAVLAGDAGGGVYLAGIVAEVDGALLERALDSTSARTQAATVADVLALLDAAISNPEAINSPVAQLGALRSGLQTAAGAPNDATALASAVDAAGALASALNSASSLVEQTRADADARLRQGADELVETLQIFETVNRRIVEGTALGRDITDDLDQRNGLVRKIAEQVEIKTSVRADNDMVLHLANGVTLFETTRREIAVASGIIATGQPGPVLRIDGVPLTQTDNIGGRLGGWLYVRDGATVLLSRQLDEIARGLLVATAERDQSAVPSAPDLMGLFTFPGGPALPPTTLIIDGLAGAIRVNANVDPQQGGDLGRLRDGGIAALGDPRYIYNTTGGSGFSDRLIELVDQLSASQTFASAAGISGSSRGVMKYAADSSGWLASTRANNQAIFESKAILAERTLGAWQSRVGINLDDELTALMTLERSYQASSRLISSINGLFDSLLAATR